MEQRESRKMPLQYVGSFFGKGNSLQECLVLQNLLRMIDCHTRKRD